MAEVYWVHLPQHTDMFTQGYVGVTSKTAKERFAGHRREAESRKEYERYHFSRAINKYGADNLIVDTIVIASASYCYDLEFKLRPEANIGWNMAPGGQRPIRNPESYGEQWRNKLRDCNLGKVHSEETLTKLSEISKGHWSRPEYNERMKEVLSERQVSKHPEKAFWRKGSQSEESQAVYKVADKIFQEYSKDTSLYVKEIVTRLGLDASDKRLVQQVTKIVRRIRGGWNPNEDSHWLVDFKNAKEEEVNLFNDAWRTTCGQGDKGQWLSSSELWALYKEGIIAAEAARRLNLKTSWAARIYREYFKMGWVPADDPRWTSWVEYYTRKNNAAQTFEAH